MQTSEQACLDALREAADRLGESPTKAAYEELGMTPASATIIRVVGGWNEAKERAGLTTAPSTGSRIEPKPDDVNLPTGTEWSELSVDQRWHYRNVETNTERTLERRARLRSWVNDKKQDRGCRQCGEADPACLDFHHTTPDSKTMAIGEMVTHGYGREKLRAEMTKCDVLCANCHRQEHYDLPDEGTTDDYDDRRAWTYEHKRSTDSCRQCSESDPRCLVFHHGDEKRATVASLVSNGRPKNEILAEIERCTILCSNCHRREHYQPPDSSD